MIRSLLLLITTACVSSRKIALTDDSLVHLSADRTGSISLNGVGLRESTTSNIHTQFTTLLSKGVYEIEDARYKQIDGEIVDCSSNLNDIIVKDNTVLSECRFDLYRDAQVGLSYSVELASPKRRVKNDDIVLIVMIDDDIVHTSSGPEIHRISTFNLKAGSHSVKIVGDNNGNNMWGNFPSMGNGFVMGRYLTVWTEANADVNYLRGV